MKSAIIFTGTGPILILTSYDSLANPHLVEKLAIKGIQKFIAYEVPIDRVKQRYGTAFIKVMNDVKQTNDLRVLDYNGHNVFYNFEIAELKVPVIFEPAMEKKEEKEFTAGM